MAGWWASDSSSKSGNYGKIDSISSPVSSPSPVGSNRNDNMGNKTGSDSEIKSGGFLANLPAGFNRPTDDVGNRLMKEYGSVFVARGGATPPATVVFHHDKAGSALHIRLAETSDTLR